VGIFLPRCRPVVFNLDLQSAVALHGAKLDLPSPSFGARPCLREFSTMGCSNMLE